MKKSVFFMLYIGLFSLLISCSAGYVETEPTYVAVYRAPQPQPTYVWIDGDWIWRNNVYVYREGYWAPPRTNKVYVKGYWKHDNRGHRWVKGRWK
ncbi:hypothetical protein [Flavobacterium terrisoli]|uniref:hypothetical protein n=1 Tax=Flavobacterium terrisoli TaxID=3242195 RepID=UPI002542F684|nr:hypothetical protein [Flavobacterium buctense]